MNKINQDDYQRRLARMSQIFSAIVIHADQQSLTRCLYKDRQSHCTAKFGCRNQRKKRTGESTLLICSGDDKLDYRSAWETGAGTDGKA